MPKDSKALGKMMRKFMEIGKEEERLGVRYPLCWLADAVDFLSLVTVPRQIS